MSVKQISWEELLKKDGKKSFSVKENKLKDFLFDSFEELYDILAHKDGMIKLGNKIIASVIRMNDKCIDRVYFEISERSDETELVTKVTLERSNFIAKKKINRVYEFEGQEINFDSEGMPYSSVRYGENEVPLYLYDFIGDIFHLNDKNDGRVKIQQDYDIRLNLIYNKLNNYSDLSSKIIKELKNRVNEVIERADKIQLATLKAKLDDNQDSLLEIPFNQIKIFKELFLENKPEKAYEFHRVNYFKTTLPETFSDKPRQLSDKEIFKITYADYLIDNGYEEKIIESMRKNHKAFQSFVEEKIQELKDKGFRQVNSLF